MSITDVRTPLRLLEDNFSEPRGLAGRAVGLLMAAQHRTLTRWALTHLAVRSDDRVLDIGCGGGTALGLLSAAAPVGQVVGVDRSAEMVRQARRRHRRAVAAGRVRVELGDAMALAHPDGAFDRVVAVETFYFWPDGVRGLTEAHRVLAPGGRLVIALEMSSEAVSAKAVSGEAQWPAGGRRSLLQRLMGNRFTDRAAAQGLTILSGPELCALLHQAGFTDVGFESQPHRSLGWLCAWGTA